MCVDVWGYRLERRRIRFEVLSVDQVLSVNIYEDDPSMRLAAICLIAVSLGEEWIKDSSHTARALSPSINPLLGGVLYNLVCVCFGKNTRSAFLSPFQVTYGALAAATAPHKRLERGDTIQSFDSFTRRFDE